MSTDQASTQATELKVEDSTAAGSSNIIANTSQVNGSTADVEMNGTHESKEDARDKDKDKEVGKEKESAGEKDQDQTEEELTKLFAARREEEIARRDRSLAEFLVMLDGYKPLIPEEVTEYYLQRSGFECNDPRLKRLLSLSAQKFVSDLAKDAFHFAKLRVNGSAPARGRPAAPSDRNKVVLTMDDLSLALGEHGVNVNKPDYYL